MITMMKPTERGCKMKTVRIFQILFFVALLGIAACFIFLPQTVIEHNCTADTEYKIVYVEKECNTNPIYIIEQCKNLTKEDYRTYWDSVLEDRQEELASNPITEVRPANYVNPCDRAGAVC